MSRVNRYGQRAPAPAPHELGAPFRVTRGIVAVQGLGGSVCIPAGGVWPGLEEIPEVVLDELRPVQAHAILGTEWTLLSPKDITKGELAQGRALVTAQLLPLGSCEEGWLRARKWYGKRFTRLTAAMAGAILNHRRESMAKTVVCLPHADQFPTDDGVLP